jgi:hypothetical protein
VAGRNASTPVSVTARPSISVSVRDMMTNMSFTVGNFRVDFGRRWTRRMPTRHMGCKCVIPEGMTLYLHHCTNIHIIGNVIGPLVLIT